jgi:hypothetical protein
MRSIFKTVRRGLMGHKELGPEYMAAIKTRAKQLRAAMKERPQRDEHQQRLPGW